MRSPATTRAPGAPAGAPRRSIARGVRRRAAGRSRRTRWCRGRAPARTRAGAGGTRRGCAAGARRHCRGRLRPGRRAADRWASWCPAWCQRNAPVAKRPAGLHNPRLPSSPALAAVHSSRGSGGMPRIDDELHIAVEEVEEADELAEALPRVGRIEQPIQLGHRRPETTREVATTEPRATYPPSGLHGELVNQKFGEVTRFLVVLEGVIDVYGTLVPGFKTVRHGFACEFLVDIDRANPVLRAWPRVELRVRDREDLPGAHGELQLCLSIVHGGTADLHNTPSFSNCAMRRRIRAVGDPFIETRSSRFHFTTNFPSR